MFMKKKDLLQLFKALAAETDDTYVTDAFQGGNKIWTTLLAGMYEAQPKFVPSLSWHHWRDGDVSSASPPCWVELYSLREAAEN